MSFTDSCVNVLSKERYVKRKHSEHLPVVGLRGHQKSKSVRMKQGELTGRIHPSFRLTRGSQWIPLGKSRRINLHLLADSKYFEESVQIKLGIVVNPKGDVFKHWWIVAERLELLQFSIGKLVQESLVRGPEEYDEAGILENINRNI